MQRIGVVGVGSIGSVLARGFSELGCEVRINDIDDSRVDRLPFLGTTKRDLGDWADGVVVAVPTPTTEEGGDYSAIDDVLAALEGTDPVVVIRSTMPPGSTAHLAQKHGMPLVYSPEFLRDRSGVDDFFNPDRIVLAGPEPERDQVGTLLDHELIRCDTWLTTDDYLAAELGKYAHNALFAAKVSFANQMRALAEAAGTDPGTVMDIVTADHRNTSSHLDPLLGPYGGKCLPKDLAALRAYARDQQVPAPMLDGTHEMNQIANESYDNINIEGNWPNVTVQGD